MKRVSLLKKAAFFYIGFCFLFIAYSIFLSTVEVSSGFHMGFKKSMIEKYSADGSLTTQTVGYLAGNILALLTPLFFFIFFLKRKQLLASRICAYLILLFALPKISLGLIIYGCAAIVILHLPSTVSAYFKNPHSENSFNH